MTEKTQPTDAEILDAADDFRSQYTHGGTTFDEFDEIGFARAVLAKWGTPAPVGAEPVAWRVARNKDEYELFFNKQMTERRAECFIRRPTVEPLYTADQVLAMERVPLTDEHIRAMLNKHPPEDVCGWSYRMGIDDAELHHGIKGFQHVE